MVGILKKLYMTIRLMVEQYFRDHIARSSAQMAYYLLFSLFPLLIFVNSLVATLNVQANSLVGFFTQFLPPDIMELILSYFEHIASMKSDTILYAGLVLTVYSVGLAINAFVNTTKSIYGVQKAGFFEFLKSFALAAGLMLSIYLAMITLIFTTQVVGYLEKTLGIRVNVIVNIVRFAVIPVYTFMFLVLFHRTASHKQYSIAQSAPGSVFSVVGVGVVSYVFSSSIGAVSKYSVLYGSLGAIIMLMFWLYLMGIVLNLGSELNYILKNKFEIR